MKRKLSHVDERGAARMVDVGVKEKTHRVAVARGGVRMRPATLRLVLANKLKKGDVLQIARIAAISAAKETSRLIPLCHPLAITNVDVDFHIRRPNRVQFAARAEAYDRTGVEMEALTAVAVCGLTIYDMCKAVDKDMVIEEIMLIEKSGGKSGHYKRKS